MEKPVLSEKRSWWNGLTFDRKHLGFPKSRVSRILLIYIAYILHPVLGGLIRIALIGFTTGLSSGKIDNVWADILVLLWVRMTDAYQYLFGPLLAHLWPNWSCIAWPLYLGLLLGFILTPSQRLAGLLYSLFILLLLIILADSALNPRWFELVPDWAQPVP